MTVKDYALEDPNIFSEIEKDYNNLNKNNKKEFLRVLNERLEINFIGQDGVLQFNDKKGNWPEKEVKFLELLNELNDKIKTLK
ncbi:MAG: hypothetical protein HOP31_10625 [Ignavibacteria bacterium]|nr:hypothetical protein [Ignavibacteria bacterium]